MMRDTHLLLIVCLSLVAASGLSAQGNLGQAGANFLQIGVEPRGASLGGAVTALSEGAAALYWNPAGAALAENIDLYLSHTDWFLDTRLTYGAVVKNWGDWGTFGLAISSFSMDKLEITTWSASEGTGEYYDAGDISIGLSYARPVTDRFTFGLTTKYIQEKIWNEKASQLAFDVGSLYRTDFYHLRLGMVIRNASGKLEFSGQDIDARLAEEQARNQDDNPRLERLSPEFRLPQVFQMGIAFDPLTVGTSRMTVLADVDVPSDNQERLILGVEYDFRGIAILRGAYRFNDDLGDISFGGGVKLDVAGMTNARLDYAFSNQGLLGDVHRFGLGLSF